MRLGVWALRPVCATPMSYPGTVAVLSWNVNNKSDVMEGVRRALGDINTDVILISLQEHFVLHSTVSVGIGKMFPGYKALSVCRMVGLWSVVLSKEDYKVDVMRIGLGWLGLPNKGACVTRLCCGIVFVSCHLSAHVGNNKRRLKQIQTMFECVCDEWSLRNARTVVIAGDMNFRMSEGTCSVDYSEVGRFDQCNEFKRLYPMFKEHPICFGPTYKYINNTDTLSGKRQPAWCDRILVSSIHEVMFEGYGSIEDMRSSDHRPVLAMFRMSGGRGGETALPRTKHRAHRVMRGFAETCSVLYEYGEVLLCCSLVVVFCLLYVRLKPSFGQDTR